MIQQVMTNPGEIIFRQDRIYQRGGSVSCKLCRGLRQGIHTGNGRRIGKYRKPAPCRGCGEDL